MTRRRGQRRDAVAFVWSQFAPYHADRCAAVAAAFAGSRRVVGIEIASTSATYGWAPVEPAAAYEHVTLFPGRRLEGTGRLERLWRLSRFLLERRVGTVFLCHYERPETLALACILRVAGIHPFVMFDSTFADKPRDHRRESIKRWTLTPYRGALASGSRAKAYLLYLGMPRWRIALGYDTVSVARIRALAAAPPGPGGIPHAARHFVVIARFVPKKNLVAALRAYGLYRAGARDMGLPPRGLVLCGDGPERGRLEAEAARLNLAGVEFRGFVQASEVARTLASALALLLPSTEEQWGLVVNEALALGVPVLATSRAGAAEDLVRAGVDGFVFEPDEVQGMATAMTWLAGDAELWARFAANAATGSWRGDAARFAAGVQELLDAPA